MTNNKIYDDSPKARSATIRTLWQEFEPWLKAHQQATQTDLAKFVDKSPILPERRNDVRRLFRQEHLKYVRKAWIERLNRRGLSVYDWIMTEEEKSMVKKALDWTPGEMIDAYTAEEPDDDGEGNENENRKGGKQKQEKDQHQQNQSQKQKNQNGQQKQKNQKQKKKQTEVDEEQANEEIVFAGLFEDEAAEDEGVKATENKSNKKGKQKQNQNNNNNQNNKNAKQNKQENKHDKNDSAEENPNPYAVPLNFVAPQFEDPDYELLTALGLTPFAVGVVESKIREFYEEACEATLLFNRNLSVLSRAQALPLQAQFDRRMQALAKQKRQEWKETINRELVRRVYEGDDDKKGKLFSKWRSSEQRQVSPNLLRHGAAKQTVRPRAHSRSASVPEAVPKEEPRRMKNFLDKVVRQVKFSATASDDEGLPPLIYRPSSMW